MALRSMSCWKSMVSRLSGTATYATSSSPKMMAYAPTADFGSPQREKRTKKTIKGEFVPVYVVIGMIALSVSLGLYTAKQQIMHSPTVRVKKKTRETIPEVEEPEIVMNEADRFVKKSFFRKIAHVQEFDSGLRYTPDPIRRDAFAHEQPRAETPKSVGVDPKWR
ncbi:hypothetical protein P3X46_023597 [Hevea brasiliensis]|uniref:Uncharacterized protein n=1 Tax=Hevea brasiliensis TaxID=3981 RepID=A0ABQ9LF87_HEVBR|nr:uncharacterized protein LOC110659722 [Hevea brasiliensis]KAJ9163978.1 hypothetical protein P3X46_023597 [Hevea brasiliensis]